MPDGIDEDFYQHLVGSVDKDMLTPVVRACLGLEIASVTTWQYAQIFGGAGNGLLGTAVFCFQGNALAQDRTLSWSLILKILAARPEESPSVPSYWKREADAYKSGVFDDLPGGLLAPRCFGIIEYPDTACMLWLEHIAEPGKPRWSLEDYGIAAQYLGRFNGAYLVNRKLPAMPWLCTTPPYDAATSKPHIRSFLENPDHPAVRRIFPGGIIHQIDHVWSRHDVYRHALDHLPQTFCHFDAFRRNLFLSADSQNYERVVAIDWAIAGIGAVGEDVAALAYLSLLFIEVDAVQASELDNLVFDRYVTGLADAGWKGDRRSVRLGYTSHFILRWLEDIALAALFLDESNYTGIEQSLGHSRTVFDGMDQFSKISQYGLDLAHEAQALMKTLGSL